MVSISQTHSMWHFLIEVAMNAKTIFTEDFTKYAIQEIQTICERMSTH